MDKNKSEITVVSDAGPIIHLDELDCLDLLTDFHTVLLSDTVWEEIKRHRPTIRSKTNLPFKGINIKYPNDEKLQAMCQIFTLDVGEIEALAIMEKNPSAIFLTDDASARLVADRMGFKVHGTIGILVRATRRGQMKPDQVLGVLSQIPLKSSLYLKSSILEEVIDKIRSELGR
ncbi:MAG: DNA-binding protein [Deltaproteobacteria bacterium]|nr:DNA-binding protein [Deltaproteobacteria bacterium]MBW1911286.1 DNA-binding protein [Deltaproteobacteria bacterium]MBW2035773.1 DNA-binding protein [Deltaproteobacteria bacterium]MBW2115317.1 DNA-binding protein [Deltaproteobacteria bacterium]